MFHWVSRVFDTFILHSGTFSSDLGEQSFPKGLFGGHMKMAGFGLLTEVHLVMVFPCFSAFLLLSAHPCAWGTRLRMSPASHRKGARALKCLLELLPFPMLSCFLLYFPKVLFASLCQAEREIQKVALCCKVKVPFLLSCHLLVYVTSPVLKKTIIIK